MTMASRYTKEQVHTALTLYGKLHSLPKVVEILGYPSIGSLANWVHKYPEIVAPKSHKRPVKAPISVKLDAIRRCYEGGETLKSVAEEIGYSSVAILNWHKKYLEKGLIGLMNNSGTDPSKTPLDVQSADDVEALKAQMMEMQMEIDILKETINVLKKDPGVNLEALSNKEKAVIIDAVKYKYSLPKLCRKLNISRSSYYYQETAMHAEDKYCDARIKICEIFHDNYDVFGYRKIYTLLKREGITLSEKVIRRIMREERLVVKVHRRRKYNSYKGEISPAVENLINRDFHADKPNQKWLTDITEFSIEAGKVYLSPIIDCLDGMPVSWTIGTSPNAKLANTMLNEPVPFDLRRYLKENIYMYPGETVSLRVEIKEHMIGNFIDWFGRGYKILKRSKDGSGTAEISIRANKNAAFFWALQYESMATILAPLSLRKKLHEAHIAGVAKYADV